MQRFHLLINGLFVLLLPIIVAAYGLSVPSAVLLVIVLLVWRHAIVLIGLLAPPKGPELELETILASHFVEKVRWCMDRLGVEYRERPVGGVIGVMFRGRTVPLLRMRTGKVVSSVGNSAEILRYLWGRYSVERGEAAHFLEPTPERLEWERRLDDYGVQLQVWVYWHALGHRELTLRAWGSRSKRIPIWQRWLMAMLYPVTAVFLKKAFNLTEGHYKRAVRNIEEILHDAEKCLASGQSTILGGAEIDFVDISFAAMCGLWLQPQGYGGGMADDVMIARRELPAEMRQDVEGWIAKFPNTERYVLRLFQEERKA